MVPNESFDNYRVSLVKFQSDPFLGRKVRRVVVVVRVWGGGVLGGVSDSRTGHL